MKYKNIMQFIWLLFASTSFGTALAATPSASMLANSCAGCHGTNGSSVGPASPTIAGISKDYFIESMAAYKNGDRPSTIMSRIAKGYTEEEVKLMAGYFSKQPFVRQKQKSDSAKASTGKKLHKKYREKCHEDGGRSAADDAGILAGQWEPFLRYTLEDFTSGERAMEKKMKKKMDQLKKKHGDKGLDELINYYASQSK